MEEATEKSKWGSDRFWNRLAIISGIFTTLICVLLVANYIQFKKSDPVNMAVINTLVERLAQNPSDSVLRKEIRTLDLLSRKAYFTSQWQIRTGGYLLLAFIALIIISLQVIEYREKINPLISTGSNDDTMHHRRKARKWIVTGGGVLLLFALVFAILASNEMADNFNTLAEEKLPEKYPVAVIKETNPVLPVTDSIKTQPEIKENLPEVAEKQVDTMADEKEIPETIPATVTGTDNYPNFRGSGGAGIANKKDIPVNWDGETGQNILWKATVPLPGNNSPIVWGDRVFITGANNVEREVYCLDRNNGQIIWTAKVGSNGKNPTISEDTGLAAPTAVTDGVGVYAIFPTGDIAAINMEGKMIWERNLGVPDNHYGHSSSLMVCRDRIIVQYDQRTSPRIMALSAKTGETIWSTERPVRVSWSSPIVVNTGKRTEIILTAEPYVAAYDPADGKELWKIACITGEVGPSLAYANGIVFSVNEYSTLCAIKVGDAPNILWENNEYLSEVSSPVATDKYLFLCTSYGTIVCYDAVTGEKYWEHDTGDSIYSSPVIADGNVYILDRSGVMHIIKADKEFTIISEPRLGENSVCTAAFTNGRIYLRGEENLYCIGQ